MEVIYLLLPLAVLIAIGIAFLFFWAVKSGQFDDLEGPAHRILMDDEAPKKSHRVPRRKKPKPRRPDRASRDG